MIINVEKLCFAAADIYRGGVFLLFGENKTPSVDVMLALLPKRKFSAEDISLWVSDAFLFCGGIAEPCFFGESEGKERKKLNFVLTFFLTYRIIIGRTVIF